MGRSPCDDDMIRLGKSGSLLVPQQISWRRAAQITSRGWASLYPFHQRWQGKLTITEKGAERLRALASCPAPLPALRWRSDMTELERMRARHHAALEASVTAEKRAEAAEAALVAVKAWSQMPCPCEGEQPDPCPVCGATVAEGVCRPGQRLPDKILRMIDGLPAPR